MNKSHTFYIQGMHCAACTILTESEALELTEIKQAKANLTKQTLTISGDFNEQNLAQISADLNARLNKHGYKLTTKLENEKNNKDFKIAIPIAVLIIALFIFLQKLGLVNLIQSSSLSYGTAFIIGIVASLSTCMAVVGGLVLSLSTNFTKQNQGAKPHILFHLGRLIGFFILGGLVGLLGSAVQLGALSTSLLSIIVALIMLILGLNLLEISWTKKLQLTMPKIIGKKMIGFKNFNNFITPFIFGAITFFLPCGFTQAMQLYALSSNNFWSGANIMLVFALGTLPILSLISLSSRLAEKLKVKNSLIFKTIGLVIICFAIFNIINSLAALGLIAPIFNF